MMIFWDDAFEPPMPPADPAPAEKPALPPAAVPDEDPEEDRRPPGRIWQMPRYAIPEEHGRGTLLTFLGISLEWLIVAALYLR